MVTGLAGWRRVAAALTVTAVLLTGASLAVEQLVRAIRRQLGPPPPETS